MHEETGHPADATGRNNDLGGSSLEHRPLHSPADKCEELIGAQDTGGASHPVYIIDKFTPKTGQGVPQNKSSRHVGNQGVGHRHVDENHVFGPQLVSKKE